MGPCVSLLIYNCRTVVMDVIDSAGLGVAESTSGIWLNMLYLQRLIGDGRQSIPVQIMNGICPAGRECMIRDHMWNSFSSWTMSKNFDWTDRDSRWWFGVLGVIKRSHHRLDWGVWWCGLGGGGRVGRVLRQLGGIELLSFQRTYRRLEFGFRFCVLKQFSHLKSDKRS